MDTEPADDDEAVPLTPAQAAYAAGWLLHELAERGMDLPVMRWVDRFVRSPENRVVMQAARRAGISMSEARVRWQNDDDLAAEIGWDIYQAMEELARCPKCGIDPDDVFDENGAVLDRPRWKIHRARCPFCQRLALAEANVEDKARKDGVHIRVLPWSEGDLFSDG